MNTATLRLVRRHLRSIERDIEYHLKAQTACCGVTLAQCHTLLELAEADGASLVGLAERLKLDASTLSRTVDGLVKAGLVTRVTDPLNRRSVCLGLTVEGTGKVDFINRAADQFYRQLLARIPKSKQGALVEAIGLLAEIFPSMCQGQCSLAPAGSGSNHVGGKHD